MAFSVLKNLRSLIKTSNSSAKTLSKASTEVEKLTAEAKAAEKAGDIYRAARLLDKAAKIAKEAEEACAVARQFLKGNGEVGARTIQKVPIKFKEMESLLNKWSESIKGFIKSPQGKQFIHNVEESKVYDRGVIKSTPKNINPFGNYGGGSISI